MRPTKKTRAPRAATLTSALADFEHVLEIPVVPGELMGWLQDVQRALICLGPAIHQHEERDNSQRCSAIVEQDLGLASRVERLTQEATAIVQLYESLRHRVAELTAAAPTLEPREDHARAAVQALVRDGLDLVLRIHTQDVAVDTWFQESLNRDRGTVD